MPTSSHTPEALAAVSPPVAAYVEATNRFDLEGLVELFADDALVNDQLRDCWGKPAIREWAERDIVGQSLTMDVTTVIEHYGHFIVTANVRGKFDMTGLPDPLAYAFYFTAHGERIVQLIILRNRYDV
jgi:SnoaL-like domain